jgi:hypothetical protein
MGRSWGASENSVVKLWRNALRRLASHRLHTIPFSISHADSGRCSLQWRLACFAGCKPRAFRARGFPARVPIFPFFVSTAPAFPTLADMLVAGMGKQSGWVATCPSRQRKNFRSNICPSGKIILRFYPGIGIFSSVNAFSRDAPLLFQQLAQGRVFQPPGLRGGILLADRPRKGCALQ